MSLFLPQVKIIPFVNLLRKVRPFTIDFNIVWNGKGIDEKGIDKNSNKVIVSINSKYYRPADVNTLIGGIQRRLEILSGGCRRLILPIL